MMWSCILVWLGAKKSVTNAKWANLFPFFTMSTSSCLTLSRQLFKVGIFFRTGLSPVFQIDFFLKFQTSICQRGNHEAIQVENISIFPLPAAFKHHFFCPTYFFRKATEMSPTYKTFVPLPSLLSFKVCLRTSEEEELVFL